MAYRVIDTIGRDGTKRRQVKSTGHNGVGLAALKKRIVTVAIADGKLTPKGRPIRKA